MGPEFPRGDVRFGLVGGMPFCGARPFDVKASVNAIKQTCAGCGGEITYSYGLHIEATVIDLADGFVSELFALED